jgi:hypothetical protein
MWANDEGSAFAKRSERRRIELKFITPPEATDGAN